MGAILILAAKHTDCLKLFDNTFSLLTIDTEILLDLIHTDSFLFHCKHSDLFDQSVNSGINPIPFYRVAFLVSLLFLQKIHQLAKGFFISILQIIVKCGNLTKLELLYHHIHTGNCLSMEDNLTQSIFPVTVWKYRIQDSILLCHLFNLFHIFGIKLQHL